MDIDKKIMNDMIYRSHDEHKAIMAAYNVVQHKPEMKVCIAVFRDIHMFKEMANTLILRYKLKVDELEKRIEELENATK